MASLQAGGPLESRWHREPLFSSPSFKPRANRAKIKNIGFISVGFLHFENLVYLRAGDLLANSGWPGIRFARVAAPRPKCNRLSLDER